MAKRKPPKKTPPSDPPANPDYGKITIGIGFPVSDAEFKALKKKVKKGNK